MVTAIMKPQMGQAEDEGENEDGCISRFSLPVTAPPAALHLLLQPCLQGSSARGPLSTTCVCHSTQDCFLLLQPCLPEEPARGPR